MTDPYKLSEYKNKIESLANGEFAYCLLDESRLSELIDIEQRSHSHPWRESHFKSSIGSHVGIGLLKGFQLLGYCFLSVVHDELEILLFVVDRDWQGKGVGRQFLQTVIDVFATPGVTVFLEVRESNTVAIALYDSIGFNQVGVRKHYYERAGKKENALIFAYEAL